MINKKSIRERAATTALELLSSGKLKCISAMRLSYDCTRLTVAECSEVLEDLVGAGKLEWDPRNEHYYLAKPPVAKTTTREQHMRAMEIKACELIGRKDLEVKNSDGEDFFETSVWTIIELLDMAFKAGEKSAGASIAAGITAANKAAK